MDHSEDAAERAWAAGWRRMLAAFAVALAFSIGVYLLLEAVRPENSGLISVSFLLVLPAAICAFVAYVADPWFRRSAGQYLTIPFWLLLAAVVVGAVVLREGVICILMLAPLWLISGCAGVTVTYLLRRHIRNGRTYCVALLVTPLVAIQVEPSLPIPEVETSVVRSAIVAAPSEAIWPLLEGIPGVRPGEGAWNFSQDVIGIPRPLGARLVGSGIGADRKANWGRHIKFRETITEWKTNRRIGWRFEFDDVDGWRYTDRHLMPDSPYFRVTRGAYSMVPIDAGHTRLTIETHYWMKTRLNGYAALWGELFLGDLERNLLALVKGRAESAALKPPPSPAFPPA
jgi:hypothetical protein